MNNIHHAIAEGLAAELGAKCSICNMNIKLPLDEHWGAKHDWFVFEFPSGTVKKLSDPVIVGFADGRVKLICEHVNQRSVTYATLFFECELYEPGLVEILRHNIDEHIMEAREILDAHGFTF